MADTSEAMIPPTTSPATDVYAFGIILIELATRNDPYGVGRSFFSSYGQMLMFKSNIKIACNCLCYNVSLPDAISQTGYVELNCMRMM